MKYQIICESDSLERTQLQRARTVLGW